MYRIGIFSKISQTTIKTLHHYDEVGLLKPAFVDEENSYRYYTTEQLFAIHEIKALRQIGFSIAEVISIISGRDVEKILEQRKREMQSELLAITDQFFRLNHYISKRQEGEYMNYQAAIKDIPEYIVYSVRQVIPNYQALNALACDIQERLKRTNPNLKCAEPEYCFNVYHDGEYKEKDIDIEFCEAVTSFGKDAEGIVFKTMPAARVVSVMHKGPYENLGAAYAFIYAWIEKNGYTASDFPREQYIDGIWNKDDPNDWLTEVQVPIKK